MASLSELISESSAGDGRSPTNSIRKANASGIVPIEGEQIPLPLPEVKERRRLWLQLFHRNRYYTYHEFKKAFTLESWDAKCYPTLGRARTARYALRNHKQFKEEFANCKILIYDADLDRIVDPESPPEPETNPAPTPETPPVLPLLDATPWCPECGAKLKKSTDTKCPTCDWDATPAPAVSGQQLALKQSISQLMAQIDSIRRNGEIAPAGCWLEAYYVSKKLSNGKKERFRYYRMKTDGKALFQNKSGQTTKSLHLGSETSAAYQDWRERVKRRNAIAYLEKMLDKAERKLQRLQR